MIYERLKELCKKFDAKILDRMVEKDGLYINNVSHFRIIKVNKIKIIDGLEIIQTDEGYYLKIKELE